MFKFMNLLFQVSSKGDALCDVEHIGMQFAEIL